MSMDSAFERAKAILSLVADRIEATRSEEDAKSPDHNANRYGGSGWSHEDISSETPNENGFSDYLVTDGDHKAFVIEAKKVGEIALATVSNLKGTYKVAGPVLKPVATGIAQAASYCHPEGIPLAVLTDGIRWVVFLPWVAQASYKDKQAIVFPSFDAILGSFSLFYEFLSKMECRKSTFRVIFDQLNENRLDIERPLVSAIASSENPIVKNRHWRST